MTLKALCLGVASIAVSMALVGGAQAAAPFSDTFTSDSTINSGWTFTALNAADSESLSASGLTLTGSGSGSDLWPATNYGAALLLQPFSASSDFTATTEVAFSATNNFQGAGLILTTQTSGFDTSSQFLRFEAEDQSCNGCGAIGVYGNGAGFNNGVTLGADTWLQLNKTGDVYSLSYSTDGVHYTSAGSVTSATPYDYIGLSSLRWAYDGQTSVDSAATYKFFNVSTPISAAPEPASWALMLIGVGGLGAALRTARRQRPMAAAA